MNFTIDLSEVAVFHTTPTTQKKWSDHHLWNIIYTYPDALIKKFEALREGIHMYIEEGFSNTLFVKCRLNHKFWKAFYYQLSKHQTFEKSFRNAKGLQGDIGLKWSIHKIKSYYLKHQIPPFQKSNSNFQAMHYVCIKGNFSKFNIHSWNDLLQRALPGVEIRTTKGKEGLDRTKNYFQTYYQDHGHFPHKHETGHQMIVTALKRGLWKEYGISTWDDLLYDVFGKGGYKKWRRERSGLIEVVEELRTFQRQNNRLPISTERLDIVTAIKNDFWIKFNIHTWNHLLKYSFGKVNYQRNDSDEEKLNTAQQKLRMFYDETKRLPTCRKFPTIIKQIIQKKLINLNIHSWNDLLMVTFGRVNHFRGKWTGQKGLNRAIELIKTYIGNNGKIPKRYHLKKKWAYQAFKKSYWVEFGIFTFDDLIQTTLKRNNLQL
jgi:hypothetical protein